MVVVVVVVVEMIIVITLMLIMIYSPPRRSKNGERVGMLPSWRGIFSASERALPKKRPAISGTGYTGTGPNGYLVFLSPAVVGAVKLVQF